MQRTDKKHASPPPPRLRLFFALPLPHEATEPLLQSMEKLRGNWRKVEESSLQVTVAYAAGVLPKDLPKVQRIGQEVAERTAPFQLSLRGTGYHPAAGSPRVWFVKVDGGEELNKLAEDFRCKLMEAGIGEAPERFRAHVALARKKGPAPRVPPLSFDVNWPAQRIELRQGILRKTGPIHKTLGRFEFSAFPTAISSQPAQEQTP